MQPATRSTPNASDSPSRQALVAPLLGPHGERAPRRRAAVMVPARGFEPRSRGPKPRVLPLNEAGLAEARGIEPRRSFPRLRLSKPTHCHSGTLPGGRGWTRTNARAIYSRGDFPEISPVAEGEGLEPPRPFSHHGFRDRLALLCDPPVVRAAGFEPAPERILRARPLPIGLRTVGATGRIRTDTDQFLRLAPLPLGYSRKRLPTTPGAA